MLHEVQVNRKTRQFCVHEGLRYLLASDMVQRHSEGIAARLQVETAAGHIEVTIASGLRSGLRECPGVSTLENERREGRDRGETPTMDSLLERSLFFSCIHQKLEYLRVRVTGCGPQQWASSALHS